MGRIIDRRRVMGGEKLPYDAEIEYLESKGNGSNTGQLIDTGILIPTNISLVKYSFKFEFTASQKGVLCGHQGISYSLPRTYLYYSGGVSTTKILYIGNPVTRVDIQPNTIAEGYVIINEETQNIEHYLNGDYNINNVNGEALNRDFSLYLFGGRFGNRIDDCTSARIYAFSITYGNTLVRNFIPVRVGNVGYMYDRVSKQLFGNNGTGDFILGPDK